MPTRRCCLAFVALLFACVPAQAADTRYLPDNADFVAGIDLRQLLHAPLVKKHYSEFMKRYWFPMLRLANQDSEGLLKLVENQERLLQRKYEDADENQRRLQQLQEALTGLVMAFPADAGDDEFLVLFQGRFNAAKVKQFVDFVATTKLLGLTLKVEKHLGFDLYAATLPDGKEQAYFALLDEGHIAFSLSKDYVQETIAKASGKRTTQLKPGLQALFRRVDSKQCIWFVGLIDEEDVKDVVGGLTVTEEVRGSLVVTTTDAETAKDVAREMNEGIAFVQELLAEQAKAQAGLKALIEPLQKVEAKTQGGKVTVSVHVPAGVVEKLMGK